MGAISDWVVRKVLFEPVTFEWITETHKKDKCVGGCIFHVRKWKGRGLRQKCS